MHRGRWRNHSPPTQAIDARMGEEEKKRIQKKEQKKEGTKEGEE